MWSQNSRPKIGNAALSSMLQVTMNYCELVSTELCCTANPAHIGFPAEDPAGAGAVLVAAADRITAAPVSCYHNAG